jgi:mannose-6-phosphate isomerase-like protein (cupin superfamily)
MDTPAKPATGAKSSPDPNRLLIKSNEGKSVWLGGIGVVFKLSAEDTGGAFSVIEHPLKPRTLVPPHEHEDTDEFSIVVEGRIGARIGNVVLEATPGCYVLKPRGIPHTFWNPGDEPARIVEIISPPRFEQFFHEAGKLFEAGPPDPKKIGEIARKYHTTMGWDEWVPELTTKYNLKLFGG